MSLEQEYQRKKIGLELLKARESLAINDWTAAEAHYQEVLTLDAAHPMARAELIQLWMRLGVQAEQVGREDSARQYYRQVLKLDEHHATARVRLAALPPQIAITRVVAIMIPVVLLLVTALLGGLWSAGAVQIPAFACDAANGLCTPTPTTQPTYTPQPTFTPLPPTPTHTPSLTPTPTATPLPYADWLEGCEAGDYAATLMQVSPVEQTVTRWTAGGVSDLKTTFVLSNTGRCLLVAGQWEVSTGTVQPALPLQLNPGAAVSLEYGWPEIAEGGHTVTLTLYHKNVYGTSSILEVGTLAVNLTIVLDRDGDGAPNVTDACPGVRGLTRFNGCPDTDSDGVEDRTDCCPNTPGVPALSGCPDTDSDGFPNRNDKDCPALTVDCCPDTGGAARGCPDRDGDGTPDTNGTCPDLAVDGCPDSAATTAPTCTTVWDRCPVEVCETDPVTNEKKCRTDYQDCNPHEVCTCP